MGSETDEIIEDIFESLLKRYQEGLEESMKGSHFTFNGVSVLYYDFHKISLNRGKSYIGSPKWLKNKKTTINPKNNDGKCFQYAITAALIYEQIKKNPQRISNIRPFIAQYNWEEVDFLSHKKDWEKFESNNKSIALNILYVPNNTKEIRHAYKSKYNLKRENQVILLMITDGEKYLAVKSFPALLRGIISKHKEDFHCLNCFRSYTTKNKLKKHKSVCENHSYCYVEMPREDNKILIYNNGENSMKAPFVVCTDLECLLEKTSSCHNDPEKHRQLHQMNTHLLVIHCLHAEEHKLDCFKGQDCMKKFCKDLKEHVTGIIKYEKKEIIRLAKEERKIHRKQKVCYYANKNSLLMMMIKNTIK